MINKNDIKIQGHWEGNGMIWRLKTPGEKLAEALEKEFWAKKEKGLLEEKK